MTWQGKKVLAVIPARGGSKGIARKNMSIVDGRSLIAHAAEIATALPWVDRTLISTDDPDMAEEAKQYGADSPFMRPAELAGDLAYGADVWRHAWLKSEEHYGCRFDLSVLLEPTSPMRRREDVERTLRTMLEGGHDSAVTLSRTPGSYTPHKCLTVDGDNRVTPGFKELHHTPLRQLIPPCFHRNGVAYAARRESMLRDEHVVGANCAAVIIDRPVVNVDDPIDLEFAAFLLAKE